MMRLTILIVLMTGILAGGCRPGAETRAGEKPAMRPMRIVSLDYCADQYVLKLVGRERILALSPDADAPYSYMRDAAAGLARVKSLAENVIVLNPDLVIRSYGGGPNATAFFTRAGIPVLQIGYANDLDGVMTVLREVAEGLGETEAAERLLAEMTARRQALSTRDPRAEALYMTPGGVTTGPGTLIHNMMRAAGLENFQDAPGWRSLPLERLAYGQPDLVAAAFFEEQNGERYPWSAARHPLARRQMANRPTVPLQGAWTACGAWFILDAVEALAQARVSLGDGR